MNKIRVILILCFTIIAGCSSNPYIVTYDSDPKGAELICKGTSIGYTPVEVLYKMDEKAKTVGYVKTVPCLLKWTSGATSNLSNRVSLSEYPNSTITVHRPDAPNYDLDVQFAFKLEEQRKIEEMRLKKIEDLNRIRKEYEQRQRKENMNTNDNGGAK